MKIDREGAIFLLGGHDLEMLTIKELLLNQGFKEDEHIFDKRLSWEEAELSVYQKEIKAHTHKHIYAIELRYKKEDELYREYKDQIEIDHHNELSDNSTSLEQIVGLLELEDKLDSKTKRHYELVAANDKDSIVPIDKAKKYLVDGNYTEAKIIFEQLAKHGDINATYQLGKLYELGQGAEKNSLHALNLYERSCSKGQMKACYRSGLIYNNQCKSGLEANPTNAVSFF